MINNNEYIKQICEKVTGDTIEGYHNDNYYWKRICRSYGITYETNICNGIMIKDLAEFLVGTTYADLHFRNYYLHQIAEKLVGSELSNNTDNHFLSLILENIDGGDKTPTILTINVPALIYSDVFDVTGVLSDGTTGIANAEVTLVWNDGSKHTVSGTTGSDGSVTFHRDAPTSVNEYTFQLTFGGNSEYKACSSSVVSRTPTSETSVMNITSPTSVASVYSDGSLAIAGTLQTNDGEAISNAHILIKQNNSTIATLTTSSTGAFTGSVNGSDLVTGDLNIIYEATSYYTQSSAIIDLTVVSPSVSLASDKPILSFNDGDSAILTATYNTGGTATGKTANLYQMVGSVPDVSSDTLIGTMTDNGDGTYSCTYNSRGVGDISVYAVVGSLSSETYTIEDCICGDDCLTDNSSRYTKTSNLSFTHDIDHYIFQSNGNNQIVVFANGYDNISFECDVKLQSESYIGGLVVSSSSSSLSQALILELRHDGYRVSTIDGTNTYNNRTGHISDSPSHDKYYHLLIEINGNSLHCKLSDGETIKVDYSYSKSISSKYLGFFSSVTNKTYHLKNIKIKPL